MLNTNSDTSRYYGEYFVVVFWKDGCRTVRGKGFSNLQDGINRLDKITNCYNTTNPGEISAILIMDEIEMVEQKIVKI